MDLTTKALEEIRKERERQDKKWGRQRYAPEGWLPIVMEEIGEMSQAMQKSSKAYKEGSDADDLLMETIQASAVLTAFIEQMLEAKQPVCEGCPDPDFCRALGCHWGDKDGKEGKDQMAVE